MKHQNLTSTQLHNYNLLQSQLAENTDIISSKKQSSNPRRYSNKHDLIQSFSGRSSFDFTNTQQKPQYMSTKLNLIQSKVNPKDIIAKYNKFDSILKKFQSEQQNHNWDLGISYQIDRNNSFDLQQRDIKIQTFMKQKIPDSLQYIKQKQNEFSLNKIIEEQRQQQIQKFDDQELKKKQYSKNLCNELKFDFVNKIKRKEKELKETQNQLKLYKKFDMEKLKYDEVKQEEEKIYQIQEQKSYRQTLKEQQRVKWKIFQAESQL